EFAHGTVLSGRFLGTMFPTAVDLSGGPSGIAVSSTVSLASTIVPSANEVAVLAAHAPLDSAEIYTPGTGSFTGAGSLTSGSRALHTATFLSTGEVLIAGGTADETTAHATAELFGATGFRSTGAAMSGRWGAVALRLLDGRVLLAAGGTAPGVGNVLPAE